MLQEADTHPVLNIYILKLDSLCEGLALLAKLSDQHEFTRQVIYLHTKRGLALRFESIEVGAEGVDVGGCHIYIGVLTTKRNSKSKLKNSSHFLTRIPCHKHKTSRAKMLFSS